MDASVTTLDLSVGTDCDSTALSIDIINLDASLGVAVGWSRPDGPGGGSAQEVRNPPKAPGLVSAVEARRASGEKWKCSPYNNNNNKLYLYSTFLNNVPKCFPT